MQKRSTSRSAFVNLWVIVELSIFLLGLFLALFAAVKPSNPDPVISVTPEKNSGHAIHL
jgi:hypothetical protein